MMTFGPEGENREHIERSLEMNEISASEKGVKGSTSTRFTSQGSLSAYGMGFVFPRF
jgi:hypothetical protein